MRQKGVYLNYKIKSNLTSEVVQEKLHDMGIYWCISENERKIEDYAVDRLLVSDSCWATRGDDRRKIFIYTTYTDYPEITLGQLRKILQQRG